MAKFHVNPDSGDAGECGAEIKCPFGGDNEHYDTAADARRAYEKVKEGTPWGGARKAPKTEPRNAPGPRHAAPVRGLLSDEEQAEYVSLEQQYRTYIAIERDPGGVYTVPAMGSAEIIEKLNALAVKGSRPTAAEIRKPYDRMDAGALIKQFETEKARSDELVKREYSTPMTPDEVKYSLARQRALQRTADTSRALVAMGEQVKGTYPDGAEYMVSEGTKAAIAHTNEAFDEEEARIPAPTFFTRKKIEEQKAVVAEARRQALKALEV